MKAPLGISLGATLIVATIVIGLMSGEAQSIAIPCTTPDGSPYQNIYTPGEPLIMYEGDTCATQVIHGTFSVEVKKREEN